jgi:hypothetical protein
VAASLDKLITRDLGRSIPPPPPLPHCRGGTFQNKYEKVVTKDAFRYLEITITS